MMIEIVTSGQTRSAVAREILEGLTDWFEIPETREKYIADAAHQRMAAAWDGDRPVGFLCLEETGRDTVEIAVMGVARDHHRQGIGRGLFAAAKREAAARGYSFLQVKTVQMGRYPDYDRTNLFYRSLGFKEFEVMPLYWDEKNPCQIYVMALSE